MLKRQFGSPEDPVVIIVHGGPGVDYRNLNGPIPLRGGVSAVPEIVRREQRGGDIDFEA